MSRQILVIGSSNTDMVIRAGQFPQPGETLLGGQFFMYAGGKGANQAVAAARLDGSITFITKVGQDIFGQQALQQFRQEGIRTEYVLTDTRHPSGVALITVNAAGENTIVVASGANGALSPKDLSEVNWPAYEYVLMQLEIPLETVQFAASQAAVHGKKVILNPAPAATLPDQLLRNVFILTPNQTETEALTGIQLKDLSSVAAAAQQLRDKGVQHVVITLGAEGAYVRNEHLSKVIPAERVEAVDTTAAGDVFNGALTVALSEGMPLDAAVAFANRAAALSVTRMGAQASAPYRRELPAAGLSH